MGAPVVGGSDGLSVGDCVGRSVGDSVGSDGVGSDQTLVQKWLVLTLDQTLPMRM